MPEPGRGWRPGALDLALGVATLAVAYALKRFYSTASAEDLVWVLGPTVAMVRTWTGAPFVFEAHEGFLSRDLNLLVAPACAGLNFLIAAFCTGVLGLVGLVRSGAGKALLFVGSAAVAYTLTIGANGLRLVVALWLAPPTGQGPLDLSYGALHRAEGVIVYFTILCVSFLAARALLERRAYASVTGGRGGSSVP